MKVERKVTSVGVTVENITRPLGTRGERLGVKATFSFKTDLLPPNFCSHIS